MKTNSRRLAVVAVFLVVGSLTAGLPAQQATDSGGLDGRVSRFLEETRGSWSAWNVPYEDGKVLYDLVVKNRFRNILEIGTSTGHSTIWLAWAAAKNGGRVTTIEIERDFKRPSSGAAARGFR